MEESLRLHGCRIMQRLPWVRHPGARSPLERADNIRTGNKAMPFPESSSNREMGELLQSPDEQAVTVYGENEVMHQVLTPAIEVTKLSPNLRS